MGGTCKKREIAIKKVPYVLVSSDISSREAARRKRNNRWIGDSNGQRYPITVKGGSCRALKSRKVLMMMKAAKLVWAGAVENSDGRVVLAATELG